MNSSDDQTVLGLRVSRPFIAGCSIGAIALSLFFRLIFKDYASAGGVLLHDVPLILCIVLGGLPLVVGLLQRVIQREFGSDLLAGISIVTSLLLGEYLAGTLVVLMLSGGEALEAFAVRRASSALDALARRMPSQAHRKNGEKLEDVPVDRVQLGDTLQIFPHEICPVDGTVLAGHGAMDESYLTGEPYVLSKSKGSNVLSGAINGESVLTIRADKLAVDSRYAKIMNVMRASEQNRPQMRRLGDQLGAFYTPVAVLLALAAWGVSGQATRFLAVLVVATPCPLLIAIPVAIIGSISLAARRGIIIRDPAVLENASLCRSAIFDKTGTLSYGRPKLVKNATFPSFSEETVLQLVASLERYSKHPLASAILAAAHEAGLELMDAQEVSEPPGQGLRGTIGQHAVQITSRKKLAIDRPDLVGMLPPPQSGLECLVLIDNCLASTLCFRDEPRREGASFVHHLWPKHSFDRLLLVSGDRDAEVRWLAEQVGIRETYAGQSPEQKLALVREECKRNKTLFLGDGINDAPALTAATVGVAFGQNSDITVEAAGAVILENSLTKVDEFLHISRRMRTIALQSAVGGMALSIVGMLLAAAGYLSPVAGAVAQEVIDVLAIANSLRVAWPPRSLYDFTP
jgi:heavy metal translocating P-type ATPase